MVYQADFLKFAKWKLLIEQAKAEICFYFLYSTGSLMGNCVHKVLCKAEECIRVRGETNHATTETMTTTRMTTTTTTTTTTVTMKVPSTGNSKHWKLIAREKNQHHTHHQDSDLNYVSKRRVPNGPDPIHNRRASKARQPPGRI
ncbi:hypothetical protein QYF36_004728 [Acer negundo]|nr:hypothetical protein QYF36_004728 [Acer negundo]